MPLITNKGFTLVELMVVIAIIGVLSAALYPSLSGYLAKSKDAVIRVQLQNIINTAINYSIDMGSYGLCANLVAYKSSLLVPNFGHGACPNPFNVIENNEQKKYLKLLSTNSNKSLSDSKYIFKASTPSGKNISVTMELNATGAYLCIDDTNRSSYHTNSNNIQSTPGGLCQ